MIFIISMNFDLIFDIFICNFYICYTYSENGRVSYFFKVSNENVDETNEFRIDTETGEIRAKSSFDREIQDRYELVLVAKDHGTPVSFETLRFVTILIKDINDHTPVFEKGWIEFIP